MPVAGCGLRDHRGVKPERGPARRRISVRSRNGRKILGHEAGLSPDVPTKRASGTVRILSSYYNYKPECGRSTGRKRRKRGKKAPGNVPCCRKASHPDIDLEQHVSAPRDLRPFARRRAVV